MEPLTCFASVNELQLKRVDSPNGNFNRKRLKRTADDQLDSNQFWSSESCCMTKKSRASSCSEPGPPEPEFETVLDQDAQDDPVLGFLRVEEDRGRHTSSSTQDLGPTQEAALSCLPVHYPGTVSEPTVNPNSFCVRHWYHVRVFKKAYENLLAKGGAFAAVEHVQTLVYLYRMLKAAPAFILKHQLSDLSFALALMREILQSTLASSDPTVRQAYGPESESKALKFVDRHLRLKTRKSPNKTGTLETHGSTFCNGTALPSSFLDFDVEGISQDISPKQFMWLRNMMLQSVFPDLVPTDEGDDVSKPSAVKTSRASRKLLQQFTEIDHVRCLLQIFASLMYWDTSRAVKCQSKFQRHYSNFTTFAFLRRLNNQMAHSLFQKKFSCLLNAQ